MKLWLMNLTPKRKILRLSLFRPTPQARLVLDYVKNHRYWGKIAETHNNMDNEEEKKKFRRIYALE